MAVPVPKLMQHLPIDKTWRLPVPWFVAWKDGEPLFPVMDVRKWNSAVTLGLCWCCGKQIRKDDVKAFVIGPMCGINRTSAEPPSHLTCALYAAKVCPFLTTPKMKRMELDIETEDAPGIALKRNPGCCGVWVTRSFVVFSTPNGPLIEIGDPTVVHWFAEGRPATRDEVVESINSGIGSLEELARQEGLDAETDLASKRKAFEKWLPV